FELGRVDRVDARLPMDVVGADRDLPAEPGTRIQPEILQCQRHEPGGHLLAGRDDDVILARIVQLAHLPRPIDELVGRAGHGRDEDGNFTAGLRLPLDAQGGVPDALKVGDRGPAEFLDDTRHLAVLMPQTWNRNARMAGRRLARRHSRRTFRASEGCCPPAAASPILAGMAGYGASDPAAPNAGAETVTPEEIGRFAAQSAGWWDPEGSFRPLHRITPVRLQFVRRELLASFDRDARSLRPFAGLKLLDIGCGGGLVSEPMARLG